MLDTSCQPAGSAATGAACTRTGSMNIDSNCETGGVCTTTGGLTAVCHKPCAANTDCASAEKCLPVSDTVGFCVPSCTPGGTTCGTGADCSAAEEGIGSTQTTVVGPFWTCRAVGTGNAFDDCMRDSDCKAGMLCDGQNGWCTPLCQLPNGTCPQPPAMDGGTVTVSCQALDPNLTPGACFPM
jgi:hypothetical protein